MERHSRRKIEPEASIHPDHFYRYNEGYKWFGYMSTQMNERIKSGDVPMPVRLSDDGRAKGWYGRVILAHQAKREEKSREQEQRVREQLAHAEKSKSTTPTHTGDE